MLRIPPILVVLVVGAAAYFCVMQIRFSSDIYELLPQDLPEVRGMEQINNYFSRHAQLVVTVKGDEGWAVAEACDSLEKELRARGDLVSDLFRELGLENLVAEGGELLAWAWVNGDPRELDRLSESLAPGRSAGLLSEALVEIEDSFSTEGALIRSYDPLKLARLEVGGKGSPAAADPMRSHDGRLELIYAEGKGVDFSDYREARHWLEQVRTVVSDWEQAWNEAHDEEGSIRVGLTGTPAFMAEVGAEMEGDMTVSVALTLVLISILFYVMHRQLKPLSWLLATMMTILAVTLAIGGWLFGELSVMSVGFAAILMGLAVDYGIVLYREAIDTGASARMLRRTVGPGIIWAAATTAAVFLSLNLSSLPGLAEMGNLVALGVLVGALVMLFFFAPVSAAFGGSPTPGAPKEAGGSRGGTAAVMVGVATLVLAVASALLGEAPHLEANFHPFRMKDSPAISAWKEMQLELSGSQSPTPAVVRGRDLKELHGNLALFERRVTTAREGGLIAQAVYPTGWIPHPGRQLENAPRIRKLLTERDRLLAELEDAGFSEEGKALTKTILDTWESVLPRMAAGQVVFPSGSLAKWTVDRVFREDESGVAVIAAVRPVAVRDRAWIDAICDENANVASLQSLGTVLNERIRQDLWRVFLPMVVVLLVILFLVYRSWRDLLLSVSCLVFTAAAMIILTVWTPLAWNSFNVCGLLLLFGTGLDFSIHMILALRRGESGGDLARRRMGKAVIFCGLSSGIGFGSLATASAHGLSSLGVVCAAGILINAFAAVYLLPGWYRILHRKRDSEADSVQVPV